MVKREVFVTLLLAVLQLIECRNSCGTQDREGTCQLLSKCKPLLADIRKAGKPMPTHLRTKLQKLSCGFEGYDSKVCCPPSDDSSSDKDDWENGESNGNNKNTDSGGNVTLKPITENTINVDVHNKAGESPPDITNHPRLSLLSTCCCGVIEDDRIWGGNKTRLFEMPWMVLLSYDYDGITKLACGGTLISERYVLTAAHCVAFLGRLKLKSVLLGEHDIRQDPDCEREDGNLVCAPNVRNVAIDQIIAHPGYTPQRLTDDIALIKLSEPADFTLDSMKAICLPITPELQRESLSGLQGVVAGWGVTEQKVESPVLLSVTLPIVNNEECQRAYKGTPTVYNTQMCAGGVPDKDSCAGDSGGPLLYPGKVGSIGVRYVQRGIVSYGSKTCAVGGLPAVYTRVAYYMDWILDNMEG